MRRREFITLLGGGTAVWPLAARAQERLRRIGMLVLLGENDPLGQARTSFFRQGLQKLGWIEGINLSIDYHWLINDADRARTAAQRVAAQSPDAIIANGTPALAALQKAVSNVPIVFIAVTDPVGAGYVQSLARPGGSVTGFSTFEPEIGGKWLELMREISPSVRQVAIILDPAFGGFNRILRAIQTMGPGIGLAVSTIAFHDAKDDIESAVARYAQEPNGGLIVLPTAINSALRNRIIPLAARFRLPAIYPFTLYTVDGGLICYGFDVKDLWLRSASYVDRILRGEKPADLPVQAPTKFELVINLKTAKALGITVPPALLARADEVIE